MQLIIEALIIQKGSRKKILPGHAAKKMIQANVQDVNLHLPKRQRNNKTERFKNSVNIPISWHII